MNDMPYELFLEHDIILLVSKTANQKAGNRTCQARAKSLSDYFFLIGGHFRILVPLFQNESKCETFHMKMSSAGSFVFMQVKVIFTRMASHLDSL